MAGIGGRSAQPAKPRTRRAKTTPATDEPKRQRGKAQPKPATNGGTTDKARAKAAVKAPAAKVERKPIDGKLAQRAVTMRAKLDDRGRPTSWAKVGYALKLVPGMRPSRRRATLPAAPTGR